MQIKMKVKKKPGETQEQADKRAAKSVLQPPGVTTPVASKQPPDLATAPGSITISGTGTPNEPISIVITNSHSSVAFNKDLNLDSAGTGTVTITLPADTYHITLTASPPGVDPVIYELDEQVN